MRKNDKPTVSFAEPKHQHKNDTKQQKHDAKK